MLLSSCAGPSSDPITVTGLLDKNSRTVLEEPFSYPSTTSPQVSSSIVTLGPGAETGWHLHEAPMYAYILDGTLEVTYEVDGSQVTKTYTKGEAIMEGLDTPSQRPKRFEFSGFSVGGQPRFSGVSKHRPTPRL